MLFYEYSKSTNPSKLAAFGNTSQKGNNIQKHILPPTIPGSRPQMAVERSG
jgi:hypothetical protein